MTPPVAPFSRVLLPPVGALADTNNVVRFAAEHGSWIWHPAKEPNETAVLRFRLLFAVKESVMPVIHVTADQRFQLRCDGRDVTFGPDRCDREHWTLQSVPLDLTPGEHELEALVWYLREPDASAPPVNPKTGEAVTTTAKAVAAAEIIDSIRAPMAQITYRGGFLLYAEGVSTGLLNTGETSWQVEDLTGAVGMALPFVPGYVDVGPTFTYDLQAWQAKEAVAPCIVRIPLVANPHGIRRPGWSLYPAAMPEQRREPWSGGRVRAVRPHCDEVPYTTTSPDDAKLLQWQDMLTAGKPLTVPAHTKATVLWDLENYYCGYPQMTLEGGEGALIEWSWAESLYEEAAPKEVHGQSYKGNRSEIDGKVFNGFLDRWRVGARGIDATPALWWRCGRYIQVRVETAAQPLTIKKAEIITTGYPFGPVGKWQSSDANWDRLMPIFERALRCSGHETWTDTPYYEQMCYVGDNVLVALCNYAWIQDTRLSRRSVQLYDWSRMHSGFVAERWPSGWRQECLTFSLFWPSMVRDYAWWRDDPAFVRAMLPGVRSMLAEFDGLVAEDGLLRRLPGWVFTDWVGSWPNGCAPGANEGDSSIVNLQWVLAHQSAAQLEDAFGDPALSERHRRLAGEIFTKIVSRYWDGARGLLLDTTGGTTASEHAQMFALLTGLLGAEMTSDCLEALRRGDGLAKATIYSSYYVLDALYRHGQSDELHRRLDAWRTLPDLGFTSTPESPEPTRSDAHAWGAHPAWHSLASLAGVRPAGPGFARARVAPCPGALKTIKCQVAHPRGWIEVELNFDDTGRVTGALQLPPGTSGEFVWAGATQALNEGRNEISLGKA